MDLSCEYEMARYKTTGCYMAWGRCVQNLGIFEFEFIENTLPSIGEDVEHLEFIYCWWIYKLLQSFWKTV